eukprot:m.477876 g.477876  ORF g.477876 m.477876 type:complete len:246 (+) comp20976_c0_seq1:133-870(+)
MGCSDSKAAPVDEPTDAPSVTDALSSALSGVAKEAGDAVDEVSGAAADAAGDAKAAAKKAESKAKEAAADAKDAAEQATKSKEPQTFEELEVEIREVIKDETKLDKLWNRLDFNGNGKVSLAELTLFVKRDYPILGNAKALMRSYKKTTQQDGDGDAWIERKEFIPLLRNLFYFNRAWDLFDGVDTDDDRRLDLEEFKANVGKVGEDLSAEQAEEEFKKMDQNDGGLVLFDEFCAWLANRRLPLD